MDHQRLLSLRDRSLSVRRLIPLDHPIEISAKTSVRMFDLDSDYMQVFARRSRGRRAMIKMPMKSLCCSAGFAALVFVSVVAHAGAWGDSAEYATVCSALFIRAGHDIGTDFSQTGVTMPSVFFHHRFGAAHSI